MSYDLVTVFPELGIYFRSICSYSSKSEKCGTNLMLTLALRHLWTIYSVTCEERYTHRDFSPRPCTAASITRTCRGKQLPPHNKDVQGNATPKRVLKQAL